MGIMALHIARGQDRPVFFYGQDYMGATEAYLAAALFRLFGPSTLALRLPLVGLYAGFLAGAWTLGRLLYGRKVAALALVALALGSEDVLYRQLAARGGYPETLLCGAVLLALAAWLLVAGGPATPQSDRTDRRAGRPLQESARTPAVGAPLVGAQPEGPHGAGTSPGYSGLPVLAARRGADITWRPGGSAARGSAWLAWGLTAGLGLWSDLLVAPFVVVSGVGLAIMCRREWRMAVPLALAGLAVGALPLIAANLAAAPGHDSLHAFLAVDRTGGTGQAPGVVSALDQVAGTLLVSLPVVTGAGGVCRLSGADVWPLSSAMRPPALFCTAAHGAWGLGLAVLWTVAVVAEARRGLRARGRARRARVGRLLALAAAGLTVGLFARGAAPAVTPWSGARYLVGVLVVLPALLAPLLARGSGRVARVGALLVGAAALLAGTLAVAPAAQGAGQASAAQQILVTRLLGRQYTRVYTDYWTCNWLAFLSDERVVCAVLDERLKPGYNRTPGYAALVAGARAWVAVFPRGTRQDHALAARAGYHREVWGGYAVYIQVPPAAYRDHLHGGS